MATEVYDIQPNHIAIYQKYEYLLVGTNGSGLFDPAIDGTTPILYYIGCNQYRCTYEITDGKLLLRKILIQLEKDKALVEQEEELKLFGTILEQTLIDSYSRRSTFYSNGHQVGGVRETTVSIESWDFVTTPSTQPVPFTGSLLLGDGFIGEKMVRNSVILDDGNIGLLMYDGPYPASRYQTLLELSFEDGRLVKELDRSSEIKEFRRITVDFSVRAEDRTKWEEDIKPWIMQYMNLDWLNDID